MRKIWLIAAATLGFLLFFGTKSAFAMYIDNGGGTAISTNSPVPSSGYWNPPDTNYPGLGPLSGDITPYYDIGNDVQYKYYAQVRIYAKLGDTLNIVVTNAGAGCQSAPPSGGAAGGPDYNDNGSSYGPTTYYYVAGGSYVSPSQIRTGADGCSSQAQFNLTVTNSNSFQLLDAQGNKVSYDGVSRYITLYANAPPSESVQGENSFRIQSTSTDEVGVSNALTGYGFRDKSVTLGNHWTSQVIFGLLQSCTALHQTASRSINYADMDPTLYDNPSIMLALQKRSWGSTGDWQTVVPSFTPGNSGKITQTFDTNYRYRLLIKNVGSRNSVFIGFGSALSEFAGKYHMDSSDCQKDNATCSISTSPATLNTTVASNTPVTINITATNTGTTTWNSTYYMRRTGPTYKTLQSVSGSVAPGKSYPFSDSVTSPAAGQTLTVTYKMYNSTGSFGTGCSRTIKSRGASSSYGSISFDCDNTSIYLKTVATESHQVRVAYTASYQTDQPPPYPSPPPPDPSGPYTYDYTAYKYVTEYWTPAHDIAYEIDFFDSSGNKVGNQQGVLGANNGVASPAPWNTFQTWNPKFLWPHNAYTAKLYAQVTGSFAQGDWNYTHDFVASDGMPRCLDATECVGSDAANVEPGDTATFHYNVTTFTNQANKPFPIADSPPNAPGSGYAFYAIANPGYFNPRVVGSYSINAGTPANPSQTTEIVTVQVTADWEGSFALEFMFAGKVISLDSWGPTSCGTGLPGDTGPPGGVGVTNGGPTIVATEPYFKGYNGDMSAGGAFEAADGSCTIDGDASNGTILGFAYPSSANGGPRGASTDFGAYALGLIQGDTNTRTYTNGYFGFFDSAINNNSYKNLSFANYGSSGGLDSKSLYGGLMAGGGNAGSDHCVADYFDTAAKTGNPVWDTSSSRVNISRLSNNNSNDPNNPAGQYFYQPSGDLTITGGKVTKGEQITVFVKGDVYISGNITYDESWKPTDLSNAPYLAIIAEGNITLDPSVTELDGLYIAQGDGSASGIFATCPGNPTSCPNKLTVNGAVIAGQVELLRSDLGSGINPSGGGTLEYSTVKEPASSPNVAEVFNFIPSMVLGSPNFQPQQGTGAVTPGTLQGLTQLPPVF